MLHADPPPSPSPISVLTDLIVYTRKKIRSRFIKSVAVLAGEQTETKDNRMESCDDV